MEEGTYLAVKRGSPDRLHGGKGKSISTNGNCLYICARQSLIDVISEGQSSGVEGSSFTFDDQASLPSSQAFPHGWRIGGSGFDHCWWFFGRGGVSLPPLLSHCGPQWG